ncbi:MAG: hypothetical protein ACRC3H_11715 [Lachnospiraceae bacterium]
MIAKIMQVLESGKIASLDEMTNELEISLPMLKAEIAFLEQQKVIRRVIDCNTGCSCENCHGCDTGVSLENINLPVKWEIACQRGS